MPPDGKHYLPLVRSPFQQDDDHTTHQHPLRDEESHHINCKIERSDTFSKPAFRRFEQASHSELFYDLFFVANLTVFTYVHEINDSASLQQYIGFFCLLWFTWYQVSLYDVRFAMDSAFERVCKLAQLLVMIGFAICGPKFNVGEATTDDDPEDPNLNYFQALSIVLMASRLVLVVQYLQALFFARKYRKSLVPVALIIVTHFAAAMVYLGLFWGVAVVDANGKNHTYYTWYAIAVLETLLVTLISIYYQNLSFEGTHLVERMSLLTLIILGEGAIATAKACQYIAFSDGALSSTGSVGASIFCAVLILFSVFMIYFDFQNEEYFGPVRTQIWSFLHFPLHLALVLAVEGISQSILWNAAVRRSDRLTMELGEWDSLFLNTTLSPPASEDFAAATSFLNATATELLHRQLDRSSSFLSTQQGTGYFLQLSRSVIPAILNGTEDLTTAHNAYSWTIGVLYGTIFKIAGFYGPETYEEEEQARSYLTGALDFSAYTPEYWRDNAAENVKRGWKVFSITYTYFFVSIGLAVVLLAALAWLNRGRQARETWYRLVATTIVGIVLTLLSTMVLTPRIETFVLGPWILPTVTLCLSGIVLANSLKLPGRAQRA